MGGVGPEILPYVMARIHACRNPKDVRALIAEAKRAARGDLRPPLSASPHRGSRSGRHVPLARERQVGDGPAEDAIAWLRRQMAPAPYQVIPGPLSPLRGSGHTAHVPPPDDADIYGWLDDLVPRPSRDVAPDHGLTSRRVEVLA